MAPYQESLEAAFKAALADPRASGEGDFSRLIYRIWAFVEALGAKVSLDHTLPENVAGRIFYDEGEIHLNMPTAAGAALVIAHEAGHWLSYLRAQRFGDPHAPDEATRENMANMFGWYILHRLDIEHLVTKEEWKASNEPD